MSASQQPTHGKLSGSCLCGASTFTVLNQPIRMLICHCDNCKKWSGSAFAANIWFPASALTIDESESARIQKYADSKTDSGNTLNRHFCGDCGASLYLTIPHLPDVVSVTSAAIDGKGLAGLTPEVELYRKGKCAWVGFGAEMQSHEAGPN